MLTVTYEPDEGIFILEPSGLLTKADFISAASEIDAYIDESGKPSGLIIHSQWLHGWDSFSAMKEHLAFIKSNTKKFARIALVTDSPLGLLGIEMIKRCMKPEMRLFSYGQLNQAKLWMGQSNPKRTAA